MNVRKTVLAALALLLAGTAQADVSANLGFASDYYYRGIFQADSSANGGLDFESGGFYAGTWAADVKDGLEVDGYFGYGGEVGDFGYSIGYTGYFYTGDFDDTYQEINLGGSFGLVALDVAVGEYENFTGPTLDPEWTTINPASHVGFNGSGQYVIDGVQGADAGLRRNMGGSGSFTAEVSIKLGPFFLG